MSENSIAKIRRKFLTTWSVVNMCGWFVGICFVFLVETNLEYTYKFSASRTFLIWIPLGASIGLFQWFRLKKFGVRLLAWILITSIGFSAFFTLYSWVLNFDTFDYREYNIPDWLINSGLAITTLIGGAIVGDFQSIVIRKHVSSLGLWISAYVFAPFLAFAVGALAFTIKSVLLKTLYFFGWYYIGLGPGKFILLFALMILITSVTISLFTGKALLKQLTLDGISKTGYQ
jgi:hypothetical protein